MTMPLALAKRQFGQLQSIFENVAGPPLRYQGSSSGPLRLSHRNGSYWATLTGK
jgi:hypothetical protein